MAARLITILNELKTDLSAIDGTGAYTHDVSGSGQIVRGGDFDEMPTPSLSIHLGRTETGHHAELGRVDVNVRQVSIQGKVGVADSSVETREDAALNLVNDIIMAGTADRTLNGNVIDIIPVGFILFGTDPKQQVLQVGCEVVFSVKYQADRGTQRI